MDVDVLILGCTHYPLLLPLLADVMGDGVTLVDSARETARETRRLLEESGLLRTATSPAQYTFVASDSPLRFRDVGRGFLGDLVQSVERVDVEGYGRAA
jgi:glutamate racemase